MRTIRPKKRTVTASHGPAFKKKPRRNAAVFKNTVRSCQDAKAQTEVIIRYSLPFFFTDIHDSLAFFKFLIRTKTSYTRAVPESQ